MKKAKQSCNHKKKFEKEKMPGKLLKEVMSLLPVGVNREEFARRWALSELELPACGRVTLEGGCKGVVKNGGLYTQCMSKVCSGGFCRRCMNSFVEDGMPKLGLWSERISKANWTTTDGRSPITYMQYLKKMKMTREDGEEFLRSKDIEVSSIPASEWELPSRRRGRGRAVSDTSSEGERTTIRFLPLEGKKKSPKKDESHSGKNGAKLRVCVYQESKVVTKVNPSNWTDEAHAKFAELYCEGRMGEDEGKEFGKSTKRKKKDAAADQLLAMQAEMEKLKAQLAAAQESKKDESKVMFSASFQEAVEEFNAQEDKRLKELSHAAEQEALEKKRKEAAVKKARAEKKAKAEAEKKRKAEELKAKAEAELKKQLAALDADEEDQEVDELGEFDDSDDEDAQEFNPYEHNGVTYHRDDEDKLYTEDGDYWGYINDSGEAVEGDEE